MRNSLRVLLSLMLLFLLVSCGKKVVPQEQEGLTDSVPEEIVPAETDASFESELLDMPSIDIIEQQKKS